jgi:hypothetical protein
MANNNIINENEVPSNWEPLEPATPHSGATAPTPHDMPQLIAGSIAPGLQHDTSFVSTAVGSPRIPSFSLMPPPTAAIAAANAASKSVALNKSNASTSAGTGPSSGTGGGNVPSSGGGGGGGSSQITLNIPIEFTPQTQTVTLPGPLAFTWAPEPAGYEFAVPNGSVGFDGVSAVSQFAQASIGVTSPVPSTSPEWALYLAACSGTGTFAAGPTGWSALPDSILANNPIYTKAVPAGGTVSATQTISTPAFVGEVAAILLFSGVAVTVVQSGIGFDIGTGAITVVLPNPTVAGNMILAINTVGGPAGTVIPCTFTDSQGLSQSPLLYIVNQGSTGRNNAIGLQVSLFSPCTTASESVTVRYPPTQSGQLVVYEISALSSIAALPRFMPEALFDLSTVTGILPVLNGGTGANLSATGGAGKFVRQFTLGGPFTVGTIAASDLTNTTVGTGAIVLATNPSITGTFLNINGIATVSNGIPIEAAQVNLTGQVAAIAATTLFTPASIGMYRISAYLKVTTVDATSSTLGPVTITYTDGTDSVAQSNVMLMASETGAAVTSNAGNTTAAKLIGSMQIWAKTGVAIKYAIAYASNVAGTMAYEVHLMLEAM